MKVKWSEYNKAFFPNKAPLLLQLLQRSYSLLADVLRKSRGIELSTCACFPLHAFFLGFVLVIDLLQIYHWRIMIS